MGHRRLGRAACTVSLALAGAGLLAPGQATADSTYGSATPAAHVWLTTVDRSMLLADGGTVPFTATPSSRLTITVDPSRAYQTMQGFGASITDSSAAVLYRLQQPERDAAMRRLFHP